MTDTNDDLKFTPLHALHLELGGKMVPFAGYDMPVQYKSGILTEHLQPNLPSPAEHVRPVSKIRPSFSEIRPAHLSGT